ncbi:MAG: DNA (cytosine-5)-methyltransferase 1 [Oleiphilaceae bacterium]|jgi:DNA (cytosine-5)-methyltransferase 1
MTTIINSKIGSNKGRKRVWVEGRKIQKEGFIAGLQYTVKKINGSIVLTLCDEGEYKVSKRTKNGYDTPIIDMCSSEILEGFNEGDPLRIQVSNQKIVISTHQLTKNINDREARLNRKLATGETLTGCSLFHGLGVLDSAIHEGFKRSGLNTALQMAVEVEGKYLEASLANNHAIWNDFSTAIHSPIEMVELDYNPTPVDMIIAGIPCTGASKSGKSKNKIANAEEHKAAGDLFYDFLKFCEKLNPSIIIIENVVEYGTTTSMTVIRSVLGRLGYDLSEMVLGGGEYGVLEDRKRLCVIATSKGLNISIEKSDVAPVKQKEQSINEILEYVPDDSSAWKTFDYLAAKELKDIAAGKGFKRQLLNGTESSLGTIGKGYNKCRSTEPFIVNQNNPKLSRLLTPTEHAKAKGIPAYLIEGLSATTAHECLGQSIAYPAFESVGVALAAALNVNQQTAIAA